MIALDVSRLLSRAGRETPTGIDRVELAYAERLMATDPAGCFAAMTPLGALGLLPRREAEAFVGAISKAWRGPAEPGSERTIRQLSWRSRAALLSGGERSLMTRLQAEREDPVYLLVSHHHLEKRELIARVKARGGARFVCLIHDLIPIEFPEYAKPGQAQHHLRRIQTAARLADALIVNSAVTRDALQPHLDEAKRTTPVLVAPFGFDLPSPPAAPVQPPQEPYFVYLATIEARKNHILLLNLWRQLAGEFGSATPRLILIGQRGWETENVVDMLERCPALRGIVIEHNTLPDSEMAALLQDARALLLPSFAEGFGFPIIEAFGLGVPALCSDIRALRETGGAIAEYIDPLDGPGWRAAILDYAMPNSGRRAAQRARLSGWRAPRWEDHFTLVERFINDALARTAA